MLVFSKFLYKRKKPSVISKTFFPIQVSPSSKRRLASGTRASTNFLAALRCGCSTSISEQFSSTSSLPIDNTTPVIMFTQSLRATVRATLSFKCSKANSFSAPQSPVLRGSKLPAWSRDEPSSPLQPFVKVRDLLISCQTFQLLWFGGSSSPGHVLARFRIQGIPEHEANIPSLQRISSRTSTSRN